MPLIRFENVTLGYEGQSVIKGLTFEIHKGDYLCVVGHNGSGKSTMIKALLGFIAPMSGKIIKDKKLKNSIGYLPQQQPSQADFPASVKEVVLSGCQGKKKFFSFYNAADKALAQSAMEKMNIAHLARYSFKELSGGQKQRTLLARALCAAEDLILFDEPATGLDPIVTKELYETISSLNRAGMTVIMVSHDLDHALPCASHVLQLDQTMRYFGSRAAFDPDSMKEE